VSELPARESVDGLLRAAGLDPARAAGELSPLSGGANNRVYAVDAGTRVVLKVYYQDERPRLRAEFSFLKLAQDCGVDSVPMPLACDERAEMALYELRPGRRMTLEDLDATAVERAALMFATINEQRQRAVKHDLPLAAEACFTVAEHLRLVQRRIDALLALIPADDVDTLATEFVSDRLAPAWRQCRARVESEAVLASLDLDEPIPDDERCVSPSDFGFHNALIDDRGAISFLDFEYSGWDDPAKMVCDFFSQVAVPVAAEHRPRFDATALAPFSGAERIRERIVLLAPVYRVKWTCIVLNDFLAHGRARRSYALGSDQDRERRSLQLRKATALLDRNP
jgi:Phosphotransferase enzyme family